MNEEKKQRERPVTTLRKTDLLLRIESYIRANLNRKVTLREVSEEFGISVSTVTQLFQRHSGTTFHGYSTAVRMKQAQQLIRQGVPLEQVGKRLGYNDHSSFYRAFRQTFGVAPREYKTETEE